MALVPSRRWSTQSIMSLVREMSKTNEQQQALVKQGRLFFNLALSEVVTLLNNATDPSYIVAEPLTVNTDLAVLGNTHIDSVNATTHKITRKSGSWSVGQVLCIAISERTDQGDPVAEQCIVKITSIDSTTKIATYVVLNGSDVNYSDAFTHLITVGVIQSLSTSIYDLSLLAYEVDRVITVLDANVGECIYVKPTEFYSIDRTDIVHQSYKSDIIFTCVGNKLHFRAGSSISGSGAKTLIYQRQPVYPSLWTDSEWADISDKWVALLAKKIYSYILLHLENDIPVNLAAEINNDYASISAFMNAEFNNTRLGKPVKDDKKSG